ncbi:MAG: 16S rRNA (cytosine(1402)-N(4))-methyltransferase RsmH [Patescibacteria group bacterium]
MFVHESVLLNESIDSLNISSGKTYLDGTLGSAGHAALALERAKRDLTVIGLDRDEDALRRSKKRLERAADDRSKIHLKLSSYGDLDKALSEIGIDKVDALMLDLGLSSDQFETSGRGFSFKKDEPLIMTFAEKPDEHDLTAKYILNNWQEQSIADVIYGYGEERYALRIARKIISYRERKLIETTHELVEIVNSAVPSSYRHGRIHPATRTFQALRITVNDELNTLKEGLKKGFERLRSGGRMAVISFHSLEDRIVKNFYKEKVVEEKAKIITKKPIVPSEEEIERNPRSRSAKLRVLEKN